MPSAPSKEELLAQALADFLDRQAREEAPAIEGFCREHPEIADDLRPQLETLAEIDRAVGLSEPPPPAGQPAKLSGYTILGEIGSGGQGPRISGYGRAAWPQSGHQDPERALRRSPRPARALHARSPRHGASHAPEHRAHLRSRTGWRTAPLRHGVRRRRRALDRRAAAHATAEGGADA